MPPNKIPSLMILFMTALSVWTLPHSSPNDRLNAVVNDLAQVATDYTILDKSIKDFTGQKTAFNTINLHERVVEAHLRNTINDAGACSPLNETGSQMIMDGLAKPYPAFMQDLLEGITNKKPQFEHVNKRPEVLKWLESLYDLSNQLSLALEEKVVSKDAEEIERGRCWCNGLFERHISIWRV